MSSERPAFLVQYHSCAAEDAARLVAENRNVVHVFHRIGLDNPLVAAVLQRGLAEVVRPPCASVSALSAAAGTGSNHPPPTFRVFDALDGVRRLSFPEFEACRQRDEFAYLETSSIDPQSKRGDHLIDHVSPDVSPEPRPLLAAFPDELLIKVRCYVQLASGGDHPVTPMVVHWHYDGFDQCILNVTGHCKHFELSAPVSDEFISGWLRPEQVPLPAHIARVTLSPGDVFVLPARVCHRVVTAGESMTVNWGFHPMR